MVVAASVVGMATACDPTFNLGIERVGVSPDGIVAQELRVGPSNYYQYYKSNDGGVTWEPVSKSDDVEWGGQRVETPRGTFAADDQYVLITSPDGTAKRGFSADYVLEADCSGEKEEYERFFSREHFNKLESLVYEPVSGNVIIAAGTKGILLNTVESNWVPTAVGPSVPTSGPEPENKRSAPAYLGLGFAAFYLPLSLSVTALAVSNLYMGRHPARKKGWPLLLIILTAGSGLLISEEVLATIGRVPAVSECAPEGGSVYSAIGNLLYAVSYPVFALLMLIPALIAIGISRSSRMRIPWVVFAAGLFAMSGITILLFTPGAIQLGSTDISKWLTLTSCLLISAGVTVYTSNRALRKVDRETSVSNEYPS